ncbi:MAG TPA: Dabb family protein [Mucilaginibacter sp.]
MQLKNIFAHHVHFWLKNKADLPKFIEGLNTLATISHVKQIQVGVKADTHRDVVDRSYDASLLIIFDNQAAHDAYQIDPIHDKFVENYAAPLCEKVVVQDSIDA